MKINWEIFDSDVLKVKSFLKIHKNNNFVKERINRNVKTIPKVPKSDFWEAMVACLLTTQQRSGPDSAVTRFISINPFPLSHNLCSSQPRLESYVKITITNFGGIRRANKIADEVSANFNWLDDNNWSQIVIMVNELVKKKNVENERKWAAYIQKNLNGFGPKQSRNLLQALGLTKYEIPLDSRIIKWFNDFGFPIKLSSKGLSDNEYYNFVLDGIQQLCKKSGVYPCVLDAAIFSSFDREWSEEELVW